MNKYLIIYRDRDWHNLEEKPYIIAESTDVGSLIRGLAKSKDFYCDIVEKAFSACVSAKDYVEMFNKFSDYCHRIVGIFPVSSAIYQVE